MIAKGIISTCFPSCGRALKTAQCSFGRGRPMLAVPLMVVKEPFAKGCGFVPGPWCTLQIMPTGYNKRMTSIPFVRLN